MVAAWVRDWLLPPGLDRLVYERRFARLRQPNTEEAPILARNAVFRGRHAGQRCFVIGNGPSLATQELRPLAGELTFVMNRFDLHPVLAHWQPTYYCAADPLGTQLQTGFDWLRSVGERIEARGYFLHISTRPAIEQERPTPPDRTYYVKPGRELDDWPKRLLDWDATMMMPGTPSTAHLAIALGMYMGCSPIYLLGLDHDWLAHRSVNRHFYAAGDEERGSSDDLGGYSYRWLVEGTLKTWDVYEALRQHANARGIAIYNASAGGFLDVFPRVDFGSLLATEPTAVALDSRTG